MKKDKIRLLRADEIECRAASVSEKGASLLLYKDARADQKILDETFGMFGWKRSHQCIDGNLYCTVEVFDKESGCWVAKQDVGTAGYAQKEKSQASDSFKRACFNWGIGRELYTAPFIWIPVGNIEVRQKDGKWYCRDYFSVSSISYNNDREINSLTIINNSKGKKPVFVFNSIAEKDKVIQPEKAQEKAASDKTGTGITNQQIHTFETELERTGVGMDAVRSRYGFDEPQDMSEELYNRVMRALARTKSANHVA